MSAVDDHDVMEAYSEEVNEMDAAVTSAVFLELIAGVMVTPNLILIFGGGFLPIGFDLPPDHIILILVNFSYISVLIILVLASIYLAWALWSIMPWARYYAIIINVISVIVHIPSLSPVIVLNLILVYFLNTRKMKEVYFELPQHEDLLD